MAKKPIKRNACSESVVWGTGTAHKHRNGEQKSIPEPPIKMYVQRMSGHAYLAPPSKTHDSLAPDLLE